MSQLLCTPFHVDDSHGHQPLAKAHSAPFPFLLEEVTPSLVREEEREAQRAKLLGQARRAVSGGDGGAGVRPCLPGLYPSVLPWSPRPRESRDGAARTPHRNITV